MKRTAAAALLLLFLASAGITLDATAVPNIACGATPGFCPNPPTSEVPKSPSKLPCSDGGDLRNCT